MASDTKIQFKSSSIEAFPAGSVFLSMVSTDPKTLLGYGTWKLIGNGQMIMGTTTAADIGKTGGSMTKSVPLLAHTHTGPSHTHTTPNHTHTTGNQSANHTHNVGAHTHPYNAKFNGFTTSDNPDWLYFNATSFGGTTATGNSAMYAVRGAACYQCNRSTNYTATGNSTAFSTGGQSANHTHSIASSGGGTSGASGTGNTGSTGTANATMDVTNSYIKLFIWQRTA